MAIFIHCLIVIAAAGFFYALGKTVGYERGYDDGYQGCLFKEKQIAIGASQMAARRKQRTERTDDEQ